MLAAAKSNKTRTSAWVHTRFSLGSRVRGFTILELMISLVTLGVLTAVAVPNLSGFYNRQKISSQAESIGTALSLARSTALSEATATKVCWNPGSSAKTVDGFVIAAGNLAVLLGTSGEAVANIPYSDRVFVDDDETDDCMEFDTQGRLDISSVSGTTLVFAVCRESGDTAASRSITVSQTGRALIQNNATMDCT